MRPRADRNAVAGGPNGMRSALSCLRRTTPSLHNLSYPDDAWQHFDALHAALAPWLQSAPSFQRHGAAGYSGPWIENVWISRFSALANAARKAGRPLSHVFGPYIPILVPFTDQWVHGGPHQVGLKRYRYPDGLVPALLGALRPNAAYITVSQNDEGLSGRNELPMAMIPNVLVLSAGGYGHVPVPLLKQSEWPLRGPPLRRRRYHVSYVGSLETSSDGARARMSDVVAAAAAQDGFSYKVSRGLSSRWSALLPPLLERLVSRVVGADSWRGVMEQSRLSLCPRGFGRSSYHLAETIQMGRVPIHVYTDTPWVPYETLFWRSVGYVSTIRELPGLLRRLQRNSSLADIARRERAIGRLRASHFTMEGVMRQVALFMVAPKKADLVCRRLPGGPKGTDVYYNLG